MTISCGGSSNSGSGGPFNVVGSWQVNFNFDVGATATGFGAINSAGLGAFLDTSGNIVVLPTITGASSFSGNLTAYAVNPTFFPNGTPVETDTAQGKVNSATSITGTFASSTTSSGTFSISPYSALSGAPVALSGTLHGNEIGFVNTLLLTFAPDGTFTGGDNFGCNLSGTLAQEKSSNVFDVTFANVSGACSSDARTGIAFESKTDFFNVNGGADATYFYMMLLTSNLNNVRPGVIVIYQ
ncbi:MAG TPA: hypothetical protein VNW47_14915 [Terriglobales bacterium]|nr:hypothetical protein [Terriglobales bacterium]